MNEQAQKSKAGQGLGIAGFVLGLTALIISWIPCLGTWAFIPGVVAIVLSAVALVQANKDNGAKGLIIAALIVSIIGTCVAAYQWYYWKYKFTNVVEEGIGDWADEFENAMEDMEGEGVFDDLEDALGDLEEGLEEAAEEINEEFDSEEWDKLIEEGDFDNVLDEYEEMIKQYIDFVEKAESGDMSAIASYMKLATKLAIVSMKMAAIMPELSPEQLERFNEIDEKYKENLKTE